MKGEKHHHAKLKDSDIPLIFEMRNKDMLMKNIANHFGVSRRTIGDVLNRKLWTHVKIDSNLYNIKHGLLNYTGEKHHNSKLNEKQVYEMHKLRKQGLTYKQISLKYNISITHAHYIINGLCWPNVYESFMASGFGL